MPKVSVIIPVYNVEKYLRQCLDSVINQTLKDIEIICINDGSTDNSLEILREYEKKDERIKVIDKENEGLGAARNTGLSIATGEYIMFLDSDDWLELEACQKAYDKIYKYNNDFVMFNYYYYYEKNVNKAKYCDYKKFKVLLEQKNIECLNPGDIDKPFNISSEAWYKIYSRKFLYDNKIKFPVSCAFEDQVFWTEVFLKAKKISVLNIPLLNYRERNNSLSNDANNWKDYILELSKSITAIPENTSAIVKDIIVLSKVYSLLFWFKKFCKINPKIQNEFYVNMQDVLCSFDKDSLERTKKYYDYKLVSMILKCSSYKKFKYINCIRKIPKQLFSITNSPDRTHKIVTVLGIKFKIKYNYVANKCSKLSVVKNRIVFDNFVGKGFGCSPKYIAQEIIKQKLPYELVWLVKNENENNIPEGIKTVNYFSEKAFEYLASAKYIISNCRMNYFVNNGFKKKKEQCYIQTWHGCLAFKKIEKDIEYNKSYRKYLNQAKKDSKNISYLVSPSKFDTKILKNCFYFNGKFLETGYPRNDIFFYNEEEKNKIKNKVRQILNIPKNKRIVLYSPTFRDSKKLDVYKLTSEKLLNVLKERYHEDFVLVTRLHPNILNKTNEMSELFVDAINASSYDDIQELLLMADILITDYSSCILDFCLELKPAFVFATDIQDYEKERGFYLDIYSMPFPIAQTEEELFDNITNFDERKYKSTLAHFNKMRGSFDVGNASRKIVELIKQDIEGA